MNLNCAALSLQVNFPIDVVVRSESTTVTVTVPPATLKKFDQPIDGKIVTNVTNEKKYFMVDIQKAPSTQTEFEWQVTIQVDASRYGSAEVQEPKRYKLIENNYTEKIDYVFLVNKLKGETRGSAIRISIAVLNKL